MDKASRLGLAAEYRVMSELLLRGYNPANPRLNDGADIILSDGRKIEVKSAHLNNKNVYNCSVRYVECDFIIFWCVEHNIFYIIPNTKLLKNRENTFRFTIPSIDCKWNFYKNRWDLLEIEI